jgi:hypothetical protein
MFEKKRLAKDAEAKKVRKRRLEGAERGKKNIFPKLTAGTKLFTLNEEADCNSVGHICKRKIERGNELRRDDCQNLYHDSCITTYHKDHIPNSEDGDTFVCSHLLQRRKHKQQHRRKDTDC